MNKQYLVSWEVDVTASNPEQAAREALKIQRDPNETVHTFYVVRGYGTPEQDEEDARTYVELGELSIQKTLRFSKN